MKPTAKVNQHKNKLFLFHCVACRLIGLQKLEKASE